MTHTTDTFVDSRDFSRIARAIRFIDGHFRAQPRLQAIADHVGLSEFHFNRLFRRWAGVTPKQYLAFVTGHAATRELTTDATVLDAAYAVGLSGPGRLHDLVVTLEAMTPGELKLHGAGVTVEYGVSDTPFGRALIATTHRGVCHLSFLEPGAEREALQELRATWSDARFVHNDAQARSVATRIWAGSRGRQGPLRLAVTGTNFQLKVWQALLERGAGDCLSYSDLAVAAGAPGAVRAVANAVGANPVAFLIPCHHVLRKSGALGGYRWGEDRKRAILRWEALAARESQFRTASRAQLAPRS